MTYLSHVVVATEIATGKEVAYLFVDPERAEEITAELAESNSGYANVILYKDIEEYPND